MRKISLAAVVLAAATLSAQAPRPFTLEETTIAQIEDALRDGSLTCRVLVEQYPRAVVADSLDKLKDLGFDYATRSGLTISIADVKTPASKAAPGATTQNKTPKQKLTH